MRIAHCALNQSATDRQTDGCQTPAGLNADSLVFQPELGLARDQRRQSSHSLPLLYQQEHCRAAAVSIRQGKEKQKHRTSALNRKYKRRNAETLKPSRPTIAAVFDSHRNATHRWRHSDCMAHGVRALAHPIVRQSVRRSTGWHSVPNNSAIEWPIVSFCAHECITPAA